MNLSREIKVMLEVAFREALRVNGEALRVNMAKPDNFRNFRQRHSVVYAVNLYCQNSV